jgi:hypothetical protein
MGLPVSMSLPAQHVPSIACAQCIGQTYYDAVDARLGVSALITYLPSVLSTSFSLMCA